MVFYSTQDYLAAEARKQQAQLKGLTMPARPGVAHPPEHERTRMQNLLDSIPETHAGPNAFAIQAAEFERQRIEANMSKSRSGRRESAEEEATNLREWRMEKTKSDSSAKSQSLRSRLAADPAFQAELQRRRVTPPTDIHPAFRGRSVSDPPTPPRDSDCTRFSQFIEAGMKESPKLKLNATPNPSSVPTFRDRIEKRDELGEQFMSRGLEEEVPVFHPTPKMSASKDFGQRPATPADGLQRDESGSKMPVKTPKKSIFSKLKLSTNSRAANSSSTINSPEDPAALAEEKLPVKAQAVLGESPRKPKGRVSLGASPTKLPRSPSKRGKNFFGRKNADAAESARPSTAMGDYQRPPDTPSTAGFDGPQTAISDPAHYSYQERRVSTKHQSEGASEKKKEVKKSPMMTRSQSVRLSLFGGGDIPPTPPAKNTPPHEKAMKEAKQVIEMHEALKMSTHEQEGLLGDNVEGFVSNTDRMGPTKFGNYGYREAPTLVTKPSMYSLHASVVPDLMEASTLEEMNARVGALDLEGFSTPAENIRRSNIAAALYSSSIYSPEWTSTSKFTKPGAKPMLKSEESRVSNTSSAHTKSSSSNGTIPIIYPDLASDPSYKRSIPAQASDSVNVHNTPVNRGRTHLSPELTWHGRTHSRDHLDSDSQSIFAHHVDNQEHQNPVYNSPSTFSHTSAMPSPLQYLPATVYTPPPKKKGKSRTALQTDADVSQNRSAEIETRANLTGATGLGLQSNGAIDQISPPRPGDKYARKASLSASNRNSPGLLSSLKPSTYEDRTDVDPKQQTTTHGAPPADKFNIILNILQARNSELNEMREEIRAEFRASNARVTQRLSAIEDQQRATPPPTPSTLGQSQNSIQLQARDIGDRIPTDVAHEFYRSAQRTGPEAEQDEAVNTASVADSGNEEGAETAESETIRELRETNQKLMEMVGGFAEKIQALEQKMKKTG